MLITARTVTNLTVSFVSVTSGIRMPHEVLWGGASYIKLLSGLFEVLTILMKMDMWFLVHAIGE